MLAQTNSNRTKEKILQSNYFTVPQHSASEKRAHRLYDENVWKKIICIYTNESSKKIEKRELLVQDATRLPTKRVEGARTNKCA